MKIIFKNKSQVNFLPTIKSRVDNYFKSNNISKYSNKLMYFKTFLMIVIYLFLYISILSDYFSNLTLMVLFASLGVMKGLFGFNIVHDALHGSYSSNPLINKMIGYLFDLNGTSSFVWKVTHNGIHHTYTNIPGHDGDIDKAILLRLSTTDKLYPFHYYQNWYALILYSFLGFNWVFYSDYVIFFDLIKNKKTHWSDIILFFGIKILNVFLFIILPIVLLNRPIWIILLGYLCLQISAGIVISIVFQLAHIVENVQFPEADTEGVINNCWAVHEMMTTSNFATHNHFITFVLGGLNFQVEHHLFPNICHVHYPKIQPIVRRTAKEFNIPYYENPTLFGAIRSHFRKLKQLGRTACS